LGPIAADVWERRPASHEMRRDVHQRGNASEPFGMPMRAAPMLTMGRGMPCMDNCRTCDRGDRPILRAVPDMIRTWVPRRYVIGSAPIGFGP
jgi:hypothetical protein